MDGQLSAFERTGAGILLSVNGAVLMVIALLGPLFTGRIAYATSASGIFQIMGQDAANLFLIGPVFLAGGILFSARRRIGDYLLALSPVFLLYYGLSMGIGMEWSDLRYAGNSENAFAAFLLFVISGVLLFGVVQALFRNWSLKVQKTGIRVVYSAFFLVFLVLFAGMWIREVSDVLREGSTRGYDAAPTVFWVIRYLDLGLTIPLAALSLYLYWTRPSASLPAQMLLYGFFITMIVAVNAMGITMAVHGDGDFVLTQQFVFLGLAAVVFLGYGSILRNAERGNGD